MAEQTRQESGYAVGVQEFDWIRERQAVYVDKTEYVWKMVKTEAKYFFLSRPLRFASDVRPVWAVGMNISQDRRTIDSYRIVQVK